MSNTDPYRVLGLAPGATPDEIKAAYRRAALRWHPDRNKSPKAAEKFRQATAAYVALTKGEKVEGLKGAKVQPPHGRPVYRQPQPPAGSSDAEAAAQAAALREALRVALGIPPHVDPLDVLRKDFADFYFATKQPRRRKRSGFEKFLDFLGGV